MIEFLIVAGISLIVTVIVVILARFKNKEEVPQADHEDLQRLADDGCPHVPEHLEPPPEEEVKD